MSSGNTLCVFAAQDNETTATDFATLDTRNAHPCLDYDASTSEYAVFRGWLPRHYTGGGVTCTVLWAGTTATTGSVVWQGEFERNDSLGLDNDSDSFGTAVQTTATAAATSGQYKYDTIAFTATQMDTLASSGAEMFRFRLKRVATATADSMSGDAEFYMMEIRET